VAKEKGLHVVGTAAIIGQAKKQGLITSARATFEVLHASDFRISAAVINQLLMSANEIITHIFAYKTERVNAKTKAIIKKIVNIPFLESPVFI
jgi:ABC-type sulfate transport system permease subunit